MNCESERERRTEREREREKDDLPETICESETERRSARGREEKRSKEAGHTRRPSGCLHVPPWQWQSSRDVFCITICLGTVNASCGKTTYVHCKAGRGRSTTIVLCYLVEHKQMTPDAAYEYVRSTRPRVLLAPAQWQAVQDYYFHKVKKPRSNICTNDSRGKTVGFPAKHDLVDFDDSSVVVVTESDLDGYDGSCESGLVGDESLAELSLACRVQFAKQAAITKRSCLWLRCHSQKLSRKNSPGTDQLGNIGVDIQVY